VGFDLVNSIFSNDNAGTNYIHLDYYILKKDDVTEIIFLEVPKCHYFLGYEIFDGREIKILRPNKSSIT
jgi:hypothetical protein